MCIHGGVPPRHVGVAWHVGVAAGRMACVVTLACHPPHIGVGRHVGVPAPRVIVGRHNAVRPVHVGVGKHIGAAGAHVIVDKHVILPLGRGTVAWIATTAWQKARYCETPLYVGPSTSTCLVPTHANLAQAR